MTKGKTKELEELLNPQGIRKPRLVEKEIKDIEERLAETQLYPHNLLGVKLGVSNRFAKFVPEGLNQEEHREFIDAVIKRFYPKENEMVDEVLKGISDNDKNTFSKALEILEKKFEDAGMSYGHLTPLPADQLPPPPREITLPADRLKTR